MVNTKKFLREYTDQVISANKRDGGMKVRAPDPGLQLSWSMHALTNRSHKLQAPSSKQQASSTKLDRSLDLGYCRSYENIYNHRASIHLEAWVPCYAWEMGN